MLFYSCVFFVFFFVFFFSPIRIAITSLGEEGANLSAFRTFARFALVWFCRFIFLLVSVKGCDLSLAWPAVVQLLVFIYSGIQ